MATWAGWENDLLDAAQVLRSAGARQFLADWNAHASTDCRNNPVDLSEPVSGSTDCAHAPGYAFAAQRYTSHGNAAHAFYVQTHRPNAQALLAALTSGKPYAVEDPGAVVQALSDWGSPKFAQRYANETSNVSPTLSAPHALGGWKALRKSINRGMPDALNYSQRLNKQSLRSLARARKVRL